MAIIKEEPMESREVVVFDDTEIDRLEDGETIVKGDHEFIHSNRSPLEPSMEEKRAALKDREIDAIKNGNVANLMAFGVGTDFTPPAIMHKDVAGTPKSEEYIAQRLFEMFKEEEGRAREVALEALHMHGYRVEKEYNLVTKDGNPID